ncbi:MAG: S9 family peptidase [Muribaculaceae bacterium]|nr:S9 family peptidase [Muribaculaceae bacterium]
MKTSAIFTILTATSLAGTAAMTAGQADTPQVLGFSAWKAAPKADFPIPATADSAVGPANEFKITDLLGARRAARRTEALSQDWTTILPSADSTLTLTRPEQGARLHTLFTRMRPERFAKGKFKLESNARANVLLDGKEIITHETSDSVMSPSEASLSLKPEQTADIQVNILSLAEDKEAPKIRLSFVTDDGSHDVLLWEGPTLLDRMRVETVSLGTRASSSAISPDGKYIIVSFTEMYDSEQRRSWSELRETATQKLLVADLPSSAQWMQKGAKVIFTEKTDDTFTLWQLDPQTLRRTVMARRLPESEVMISPDGKYVLYYKEVGGEKPDGIMRRVDNPDDRQPGNRDRYYITKYDLKEGVARPLTYGGASTIIRDISPDSRRILYSSTRHTPSLYPFYLSDLMEMDVNTLRTDTLARDITALADAVYSPDGKTLFITGGPSCFDNLGKNCGDHPIANDYDIQGYLFDIATRAPRPATLDFDPSIKGTPVWNAADNRIYFIGEEGFYNKVFALDPKSDRITRLNLTVDNVRNFSIGRDESRWLSATGQSYKYAGRVSLLDLKSGKAQTIDDPIEELTSDLDFGAWEHWRFTARDGSEIDGVITLPPDFDSSKKYPLIVYYYGGTSPSEASMYHPYTPQMFASRDYVVYTINPSGTTGYGQEFSARHVNAWGDYTADDIIEGVKKFCEAHPFVDSKKIGCLGASYGGFMTQLLQTKTDLFAAAVSHAGISDVTSYWGEGFWGYSYNAVAAAESYPWTDPELFTKHGSLFNADKIHTPLLLLHGTVDTNVPIGESIQIFNALRILGRDVELVTVEGANHVVTEYDKRKLWQATIMAWFAKYLQDDPRWWNEMY